MNTYIIIGMGLGLVVALFVIRVLFRKEKKVNYAKYTRTFDLKNDVKLKAIVNEFIKQGKKIEGIKYVKETENLGLLEAKEFVESVERDIKSGNQIFDRVEDKIYADSGNDEITAKVKELIKSGKKIMAIKLVTEEHKKGLKEAKEYVEKLEAGLKDSRI